MQLDRGLHPLLFLGRPTPPIPEGTDARCRVFLSHLFVDRASEMQQTANHEIPPWSDYMRGVAAQFTEDNVTALYTRVKQTKMARIFRSFQPVRGTQFVHHRLFIDYLVACEHFFSEGIDDNKQLFSERGRKVAHKLIWLILDSPKDFFAFMSQRQHRHKEFRGTAKVPFGMGFRKMITRWYLKHNPLKLLMECTRYKRRKAWNHNRLLNRGHVVSTATSLMSKEIPEGITDQQHELLKILQTRKPQEADITDPELKKAMAFLSKAATVAKNSISSEEDVNNSQQAVEDLLDAGLSPDHLLSAIHNTKREKRTVRQRAKWKAVQAFRLMVYKCYLKRVNFAEFSDLMHKIMRTDELAEVASSAIMSWESDPGKIKDLTPVAAWDLLLFVRDFRRWRIRWNIRANPETSYANMARLERGDMKPAFQMFEAALSQNTFAPSARRTHIFLLDSGDSIFSQCCEPQNSLQCMDAAYVLCRIAGLGSRLDSYSDQWEHFEDFNPDLPGPRGHGNPPILVPTDVEMIDSEGLDLSNFRDVCNAAITRARSSVPGAPRSFGWTGGSLRSLLRRVHERYSQVGLVKPSVCIWFITDCRRDYHRERLLEARAQLRQKACAAEGGARFLSPLERRREEDAEAKHQRESAAVKLFHDITTDFEQRFRQLLDDTPDDLFKDVRGIYFALRDKKANTSFAENTDRRLLKVFGYNQYNAQTAAFFAGDVI